MNKGDELEKVKMVILKDQKNKQESYMLSEAILGKGKSGQVYKATNANDPNKVFAVKVIRIDNQKVRNEYLKQLEIIKHLPQSLFLVKIHPYHLQSENNFYIFEQYCDGGNLFELRVKRKHQLFTQQQAYNLFYQIVNGFLDLRKSNIFHEDIKPQNILIKNNIYKFTDFGISQLPNNKIQANEVRKGTLIYMPPQKLKGTKFKPTSKTQIYSLGVTLFEMIFGFHPYLHKNPIDYKEYLKMLSKDNLKSLEFLKDRINSHSLCIDKFIRIILQMIQLCQYQRLPQQQLREYIEKTQPFKSMVITKQQPKPKIHRHPQYVVTGQSNIMLVTGESIGQLLQASQLKVQNTQELFSLCLTLFRKCTEYFQQGLKYINKSNIDQLKEIESKSAIGLNNIPITAQIHYLILFFIQKMFIEFEKIVNNYTFQLDNTVESKISFQIFDDKQYVSSQLLKFYIDLQLENKKLVWERLKQKGTQVAIIIADVTQQIFSQITGVKINFKYDKLSILFIKQIPSMIKYLKSIVDGIISNDFKQILQCLDSQQYSKITNTIDEFAKIEENKPNNIKQIFLEKMNGHIQILDQQPDEDDFEELSFQDLQ